MSIKRFKMPQIDVGNSSPTIRYPVQFFGDLSGQSDWRNHYGGNPKDEAVVNTSNI